MIMQCICKANTHLLSHLGLLVLHTHTNHSIVTSTGVIGPTCRAYPIARCAMCWFNRVKHPAARFANHYWLIAICTCARIRSIVLNRSLGRSSAINGHSSELAATCCTICHGPWWPWPNGVQWSSVAITHLVWTRSLYISFRARTMVFITGKRLSCTLPMAEVRQGTNEDNDCALAPADHLQMPLGHVHCAHELATELVIELCSHRQCLVWNQVRQNQSGRDAVQCLHNPISQTTGRTCSCDSITPDQVNYAQSYSRLCTQ